MDEGASTFRDLMIAEDPDFGDVVRCVFGLQRHETAAYLALLETPGVSAATLAARVGRDRSNVSRSLATLRQKGLVERRREVLEGGGHVYCYHPEPLPAAKERMHDALDAWAEEVHDLIAEFGGDDRP